MEKIKSLADLKRIKENVQTKIDLREKSEQVESLIQIKVAMATCGIAAGSKDTMNYFIENLEKNGIAAVVTQTGCMGYCYYPLLALLLLLKVLQTLKIVLM